MEYINFEFVNQIVEDCLFIRIVLWMLLLFLVPLLWIVFSIFYSLVSHGWGHAWHRIKEFFTKKYWRNNWYSLKEFWLDVTVMIIRKNSIKTVCIILLILGCIILPFGNNNVIGIALTIFGILISARVFLEVNRKETKTIEDYLETSINIINSAEDKDDIFIIAPTFCPGIDSHSLLLDTLFDAMKNKKGKANYHLAFLKTGNRVDDWKYDVSDDKFEIDKINIENARKEDEHWKMYSKFCVLEIKRHLRKSSKNERGKYGKCGDVTDMTKDRLNLIDKYYGKLIEIQQPEQLGKDYLEYIDEERNRFKGFFAIANVGHVSVSEDGQSSGSNGTHNKRIGGCSYYIGSFFHDGRLTTFEGSTFKNEFIRNEMFDFLNSFIASNHA